MRASTLFRAFLNKRRRSILFINPDYHCTFFYREALEEMGWRADILVSMRYPQKYLYSSDRILQVKLRNSNIYIKGLSDLVLFIWFAWRYRFHFYYGRPMLLNQSSKLSGIFTGRKDWNMYLFLSEVVGAKIIYLPSGCRDEFTKTQFSLFDQGKVCGNCAFFEYCDETSNELNLSIMNRYSDLSIGIGFFRSVSLNLTPMKWKAIDLEKWSPSLEIPTQFQLPKSSNFRIFHTKASGLRDLPGKNIKGTYSIINAVESLKKEGYRIELLEVSDQHINNVKYFQSQADVVIDQLIYGHWGSTSVESMALGKPTICYVRDSWKLEFLRNFPEYQELPTIQSDCDTIYNTLKYLIENPSVLTSYAEKSRRFAEAHFCPKCNVKPFVKILENL